MTTKQARHLTDEELLWYDPFEGDKDGPSGPEFSGVVRTRREQKCNVWREQHLIPIGSRAVVYRGRLSRDEWFRFYCCAECIEAWRLRGEMSAVARVAAKAGGA